jgi:CrcB protein
MIEGLASVFWVALGAAIGGPMRFFVSGFVGRRIGETFPWGTFVVNVTGAFVIGCVGALAGAHALASTATPWLFTVTGVLGSYTTVSSFSLQTLALMRDGEGLRALANVFGSLVLCLGAAATGFALLSASL